MPLRSATNAPSASQSGIHLDRLVGSIAAHLPGQWVLAGPGEPFTCLISGDLELSFRLVRENGGERIHVTGYPPYGYHRCTRIVPTSITASAVRGGAYIAAQILRRLMPDYEAQVRETLAALERQAAQRDRLFDAVARVRELVPSADRWSRDSPGLTSFRGPGSTECTYRALGSAARSDLTFERLPEAVALEVVALVADRLGLSDTTT